MIASNKAFAIVSSPAEIELYDVFIEFNKEKRPIVALCTEKLNPVGDISPSSFLWFISFITLSISP